MADARHARRFVPRDFARPRSSPLGFDRRLVYKKILTYMYRKRDTVIYFVVQTKCVVSFVLSVARKTRKTLGGNDLNL